MIFSGKLIKPFINYSNRFNFAIKVQTKRQKTLYQILEVPTSAPQNNIRKNYIKLAKIYHPDVYKGSDKDRFQKIQKAYQTLSNQKKRQQYDQQIGIRVSQSKNQEYQFSGKNEGQSTQKKQEQKKNNFTYEESSKEQTQINLDQEYEKFFSKKKQTDFEEIRLHEQVQFRQKSEDQRIRARFTQYYDNLQAQQKSKRQMPYEQMLNDQINQRNTHHDDILKGIQKNIERNSPKGIKRQKIIVYMVSIIIALIVYPLFISFWTKNRQQRTQKQRVQKMLEQIQKKKEQAQIRSRFQY